MFASQLEHRISIKSITVQYFFLQLVSFNFLPRLDLLLIFQKGKNEHFRFKLKLQHSG
jgi:hypothetical protein